MARRSLRSLLALAAAASLLPGARGQSPLSVYSDQLDSGFQNWSWGANNFANSSPVFSGERSIRFGGSYWEAISFHHSDLSTAPYSAFTFRAHGGISGGQRIQVYAEYGGRNAPAYTVPGRLPTNSWQLYSIPLNVLGISNVANFNRISIQLRSDGNAGPFFLDDVALAAKPAPALVNVSVNTLEASHVVDERHFGVNLAMWDAYFDPPHHTTTIGLLRELGITVVRMPGGSLSDEYHWASNTTLSNTWQWANSFADMVRVATNAGAQAFMTVNYGTGTPQEAAAWVRHANITNQLGYKYWEIGNENYGTWETDTNTLPHHAFTYATRAAEYMTQMRAADPSIKIGVVAVPGEDAYSNGYTTHRAHNPRTGETNYGWTPVMLATLKALGATPDFLVHHHYPNWTNPNDASQSPNNDEALLQSTGNWAADAANLRQMIRDYFGAGGTNIELVVTENNSDAGAQGRQSTSLVNGLYYADSLGQLLRTEFRGFVWWDFRNGTDVNGYFGSNIYGWRDYGDLGIVNGPNRRHPTFYAAKLMQWFARPGDRVLTSTTDYSGLAAHAVRRANGSVTLLVINKSLVTNLNAAIVLNGFTPNATAAIRSYGIPQDEAARTNAPLAAQDIAVSVVEGAASEFVYDSPPLSLTLFTFNPATPGLRATHSDDGQIQLRVLGDAGVPYAIQTSEDLLAWIDVETNVLAGEAVVTNSAALSSMRFWRAVWLP